MTSPRKLLVRTEIDGVPIVVARKDLEDEEYSDPCFFDDDYSYVLRIVHRDAGVGVMRV
jgi:hypothetical protein